MGTGESFIVFLLLPLFPRPSSPCSPPSGYASAGASGEHFYRFYEDDYEFPDAMQHCQVIIPKQTFKLYFRKSTILCVWRGEDKRRRL